MKNLYAAATTCAMAITAGVLCLGGVATAAQIDLPRVDLMPNEPAPYLMRDWLDVTQGYVDYALDDTKTGTYLPLLLWTNGKFRMPAYVGLDMPGTSEAILALPLIVSGTLAGYDMTNYNGHDTVTSAAVTYYCAPQQMADNNGGCNNPEFWYKMLPTIFLVQLADLYPGEGGLPDKVNAIADKLYDASVAMIAVEPYVDDVANADIGVQGTVSGSYTDTQNSDGSYEEIMERESGGKPASRYSYLEHKWTIDVTGGDDTVTFYVEAHHTANSEGDDFVFAYSTDDSTYTDMLTVTKTSDDSTYQSYVLPGATSGTVYIQVKDTNQTPGNRTLDTVYVDHMFIRSIEDPCVTPNYNHRSFNFSTMLPIDGGGLVESGSAAAFAWISYMAYTKSGDPDHLTAADWGMSYLSNVVPIEQNPLYEVMLRYGPITAARMNAELGRSYDLEKLLLWCSGYVTSPRYTYNFRTGWGTISDGPEIPGSWGGYDCDGLAGSVTDTYGYAFAMNVFQSAGSTIPVVRYDSDYARTIGKWMLNLANAARLLYPSYLDPNNQEAAGWNWAITQRYDPNSYIAYEGLRRYGPSSVEPYATGDYGPLRLGLYGSSSVGYLGSIVRTTNVAKILQWDCLKTDFYRDTAYPTYLYFNPYGTTQTVSIDAGSNCVDLYDTVSQTFLKTCISGVTDFNIPADSAVVVVLAPAGGEITISDNKKLIDDVVVDYNNTTPSTCAQVQASPLRLAGDITGDCIVDLQDIEEFTLQWLDQGICLGRADIERDETVNFIDLSKLAHDWLANNNP